MPTIPKNKNIRVAILADQFSEWDGGIHMLEIIVNSLYVYNPSAQIYILLPSKGLQFEIVKLANFIRVLLGKKPNLSNYNSLRIALSSHPVAYIDIKLGRRSLIKELQRMHINIVLPTIKPLGSLKLPWVGYITDLQHKHYPQLFSKRDILSRDKCFKRILDESNAVLVNSQDTKNDIVNYYGASPHRIFALPFAASPKAEAFEIYPSEVQEIYNTTDSYFIVCNQFWQHKDHATLFNAFSEIAKEFLAIQLVCTGAINDYRNSNYFADLVSPYADLIDSHRIKILGRIPRSHQLSLLRGAIALVQPTLFEGGPGGGSVYDAVSVGQRIIISDIDINKEVISENLLFYRARCSSSLKSRMREVIASPSLCVNKDSNILIRQGRDRRFNCGKALDNLISYACRQSTSSAG